MAVQGQPADLKGAVGGGPQNNYNFNAQHLSFTKTGVPLQQ